MIHRTYFFDEMHLALDVHAVCVILGPKECGKTTLALKFAREYFPSHSPLHHPLHIFDLTKMQDLMLLDNPSLVFEKLQGTIIIDEIQRRPELFPYLRYLVDTTSLRFIILGSAARELIHQSSESLAGRVSYMALTPFQLREVDDMERHWIRGGYPKSYLAQSEAKSDYWREHYIQHFLESDLASMGIQTTASNMRRLWYMLAHYHGQIVQIAELARSINITERTIKHYMDILEGCFMIRQLQPWFENLKKRQVKRPKLYIRDSGLLHTLLHLSEDEIYKHPKLGASWEGYALENIINAYRSSLCEFFFWGTSNGAELDLLVIRGGKRIGYEFKFGESLKATKSMHVAMEDLKLDSLTVVAPNCNSFTLAKGIEARSLKNALAEIVI